MTMQELRAVLEAALPKKVTYRAWPVGKAPALPYLCYFVTGSDNFGADNIVYHSGDNIRIELYTEQKDLATEQALESALTTAGVYWDREDLYLDAEKCYMTIYEVTI